MRWNNVFIIGLTALNTVVYPILAQDAISMLPPCAAKCFENALTSQTACAPTDTQCICGDGPINAAIQSCMGGTCSVKETLTAINVTSTMCERPVRDRSNIIFLTGTIAGSIALAAVSVRTYSAISQNSFGLDDVFAIAAEAACLPVTVIQCYTPKLGFGKDIWAVPHSDIYKILRITYGSQIPYFLCCGLTKLAFLFFFLRIFPSETTRKFIWIFIFISVLWTIAFTSAMTFACKPISAVWTSWDGTSTPDYCINQNTFYLVAAAFNIGLDFAIVLIPIPNLMTLRLSSRKKLFLGAIFGVGGITILVSCVRLSAVAKYATSTNPMYDNLMSGVYSILEINVGIICVSMPAFRRVLAQLVPKCFGTTENSSDRTPGEDDTPNRLSQKKIRPNKSMLNASLFNTTIMRTVDVDSEGVEKADDEVHLVELHRSGSKTSAQNMDGSMRGHDGAIDAS